MNNITIIAAIDKNNGIGKDNKLLCHLPADLKRFKEITTGHTIIMGKNTYLSLPKKPLPERKHIIISKTLDIIHPQVIVVKSIEEALDVIPKDEEVFVIGGETIYRQFMPLARKLLITQINFIFEADRFFPQINMQEWQLIDESNIFIDEKSGIEFQYLHYEKKTE